MKNMLGEKQVALFGAFGTFGVYLLVRKFWPTRLLPSKGKVALITGCDTALGFGNAIARRLHHLGYVVFAGCLDAKTAIETVYKDLANSSPQTFHVIQLDVTNQTQVDKAREAVETWLRENPDFRFFTVVSNAGVSSISPFEWIPLEAITNVFDVNYFGVLRVTKTFLPLIRRGDNNDGRVVVMASLAGEIPSPGAMPYCASKFALLAFVDCLRLEVAKSGIKVSAICPDFYQTNITMETEKSVAVLEKHAASSPPDVFEAYGGEKVVTAFKNAVKMIPNMAKSDLTPVVDCVVDAIASPRPKRRYYPIEFVNHLAKIIYLFAPSVFEFAQSHAVKLF